METAGIGLLSSWLRRHAGRRYGNAAIMVVGCGLAVLVAGLALKLAQAVSVAQENAHWVAWENTFSDKEERALLAAGAADSGAQALMENSSGASIDALRHDALRLRRVWGDLPAPPAEAEIVDEASTRVEHRLRDLADQVDQAVELAASGGRAEALASFMELHTRPAASELGDAIQKLNVARNEAWLLREAERQASLNDAFWLAVVAGEIVLVLLAGSFVMRPRLVTTAGGGDVAGVSAGAFPTQDRVPARLLDIVGHDLRQPLQAMSFFASALARHLTKPEATPLLAGLRMSMNSMERMISGLLDMSKLDAGRIVPECTEFPLTEVLGPIVAEFAAIAAEKGIALRSCETEASVFTDPVLLESILRNIIANAIKYTTQGSVEIKTRHEGPFVTVAVADTGVGIGADELGRIFDEFYRASRGSRSADGLGLGLAVARRLAALLGMTIRVSSELDKGSVFSIAVPSVNHIALGSAAGSSSSEAAGSDLAGMQLLLVDDDAAIHEALKPEMLRSGVAMTSARSPEQVCALFDSDRAPAFDFALVDRDLGGSMSGVQLLDHLAARYGVAVPALIMTGASDPKVIRELRDSDYPFVRKPVSLAVVTELIERLRREVNPTLTQL